MREIDSEFVDKKEFSKRFVSVGLLEDDQRLSEIYKNLEQIQGSKMTKQELFDVVQENLAVVEKTLAEDFIIPQFEKFKDDVKELYKVCKSNNQGKPADYIPELAKANPDHFGVSICTVDGQRMSVGDSKVPFSVQSTSKPISYCIALENFGPDKVHEHVGHEPSGVEFNAVTLNSEGKPHNPLINAGAIMVCSLIYPELKQSERFSRMRNMWERLAGNRRINYDNTIYLSERSTADTNRALAYMMRSKNAFPPNTDITDVLEFYFQICSLQTDCETMSIIAATLANGGVFPSTGERVLRSETVQQCLSVMNSCGMYDYSGEFAFKIGLPAKSGVSGAIMIIVPGLMGICTFSPNLDSYGNSTRGV